MPHKCMKCSRIYSDEEIKNIKACLNCGGKFFIYAETIEELTKKEELKTEEEKLLGVSGEIEVKRIGDTVIITKVGKEKEEKVPLKEERKEEIIEKESHKIPYIWDEEDYRRRIAGIEKVHVKEKPKEDKGL
ncbi:MAG: Zn-ribbon containing protein, partial [Candidatus Altarchaeaceae archaeon]